MSKRIQREEVEHIAQLSRLKLTESEILQYQDELNRILSYFDQLNELDTERVEPKSTPLAVGATLRADVIGPSFEPTQALCNSPRREGGFFVVPKIFDS